MARPPDFADDFQGAELDRAKWLPEYLPHWAEAGRATARYAIADGRLTLRIDADQPDWAPDLIPGLKVSNLQTGHRAGPSGSAEGQHRSQEDLRVRTERPEERLFLMRRGRLEMRARGRLGPGNMAALWLIGFEDRPEDSGEITLMEVFGREMAERTTLVGCGIKAITDPRFTDEFAKVPVPIAFSDWADYALDWTADGVTFTVNGETIHRCRQSPDYPMQIMLNLYALPGGRPADPDAVFEVDHVQAWR